MKYPKLVPKRLCKTPIRLEIEQEGLNEYGEPLDTVTVESLCNYQDSGKTVFTADKKIVTLSAVALFCEDICPELPAITGGTAYVFDTERRIYQGKKARNPDGTVNFVEVQLI
ncbi:MAG: hypothetical protein ACI4F9_00975 [Lachnospiraceae bacterium]